MAVHTLKTEDFIKKHLSSGAAKTDGICCSAVRVKGCTQPIDALKLNFHLAILCLKGKCDITVGHHDFSVEHSTVSIVPPHTVSSLKCFSKDFDAYFLMFTADFVKKGFVQSEIMDELLYINPDYPPIFHLEEPDLADFTYKFRKIETETENQLAFCLEVSRLYVLQILFDYNRVCEKCLLNSDKLINRQFQVMYNFRKLVDKNFQRIKTINEYADLMSLSPKYLSECVKNQTGVSALTLIQNRTILEAELLLKYSQLSIKNISGRLGYTSVPSFSRFFKGIKGVSPLQYRSKQENW